MSGTKMLQQGVRLIEYLTAHPDSSRRDIERHVSFPSYFHNVVGYVRNVVGEEVLTTRYDRARGTWVYRLALDSATGHEYVSGRKIRVRNEAANLVAICNRIENKFGPDREVALTRALLDSVVNILDAAS
jgi:hypothetical protein